jgi:hypothetical protein
LSRTRRSVTSSFLIIAPGVPIALQSRQMVPFSHIMSSSLGCLFFNLLALGLQSLTHPPGVPHWFSQMLQTSTSPFASRMMTLLLFILQRNVIISCPMMNLCVHSWLVLSLFGEQIQSHLWCTHFDSDSCPGSCSNWKEHF